MVSRVFELVSCVVRSPGTRAIPIGDSGKTVEDS